LLSAVGLRELTATTPQGYVRAAVELARDHARRTELRRSLRERTTASPIMDARGFTRNLEAAHREMWRESLAKQPGGR
jgi:protein O-GlcNAc transferase